MKISFWLALLAPFLLAVVAALGNAAQAQVLATAEVLGVDDRVGKSGSGKAGGYAGGRPRQPRHGRCF